jgi:uncharacterized integral membrane protein
MRYFLWILTIPTAALAVSFAATNQYLVEIGLWPFPFTFAIAIWLFVFGAFIAGMVVGVVIDWNAERHHRHSAHVYRRRAKELETELARLKASQTDLSDQLALAKANLPASSAS